MARTATKFATPVVICREPHYGRLADGREYLVQMGDRLRADDERVRKAAIFFVADGEDVTPYERPEVEPAPEPKGKQPRKWEFVEGYSYYTGGHSSALIEYRKGDQLWEGGDAWRGLSPQLRRKLLREIK